MALSKAFGKSTRILHPADFVLKKAVALFSRREYNVIKNSLVTV